MFIIIVPMTLMICFLFIIVRRFFPHKTHIPIFQYISVSKQYMATKYNSSSFSTKLKPQSANNKEVSAPLQWLLNGGFLKWWYPQIIQFNRVFHYKPSILGYHHFRKPPNGMGIGGVILQLQHPSSTTPR